MTNSTFPWGAVVTRARKKKTFAPASSRWIQTEKINVILRAVFETQWACAGSTDNFSKPTWGQIISDLIDLPIRWVSSKMAQTMAGLIAFKQTQGSILIRS